MQKAHPQRGGGSSVMGKEGLLMVERNVNEDKSLTVIPEAIHRAAISVGSLWSTRQGRGSGTRLQYKI